MTNIWTMSGQGRPVFLLLKWEKFALLVNPILKQLLFKVTKLFFKGIASKLSSHVCNIISYQVKQRDSHTTTIFIYIKYRITKETNNFTKLELINMQWKFYNLTWVSFIFLFILYFYEFFYIMHSLFVRFECSSSSFNN